MLTDRQLDQFHRDGLLVLRGVFGEDELEALRHAAGRVQVEALAGKGTGHGYRVADGERQYYRTDGGLLEGYAAFRTATVNPRLLAAVGQCVGHPFMPINDSLVVKLPRSNVAIPWHQDPPYEGPDGRAETFGIPNFDCDIYLDDATLENGCLYGLPGHHLVGHVELERFDDQQMYDRADIVPLEMEAGDVLFHAISAPHGSKTNDSGTLRRVFYVHYMAREAVEALHPEWVTTKPGFAPSDVERVQSMLDERMGSGSPVLAAEKVELTLEGLVLTGEPVTSQRHWETLIADLTSDQLRAARTLSAAVAPVDVR